MAPMETNEEREARPVKSRWAHLGEPVRARKGKAEVPKIGHLGF